MRGFMNSGMYEIIFDLNNRSDLGKVHEILLDHIVEDGDLTYDTTAKGEGGVVNIACDRRGFQKLVEAFKEAKVAPSKIARPEPYGFLRSTDL